MNSECMCTFIVILFNCDELWFYLINCNLLSFFILKSVISDGHADVSLPLLQFCTVATGVAYPSLLWGHCSNMLSTSVALPIARVTLCPLL
jgi:hypothetical protein